ncbi:MAG: DUF2171 domain-containing protein [Solirubrobacterales bacterium]
MNRQQTSTLTSQLFPNRDTGPVQNLGPPSSYLVLEAGVPVYSSDGEKIGKVDRVIADLVNDIFEGVALDTSILPGREKYVAGDLVEEIYERGVVLKVNRAAVDALPSPPR